MANHVASPQEVPALSAVLPKLTDELRAFLAAGLILDPWLAGLASEHVTFNSQDLLHRAAEGLSSENWREPLIARTLGDLPVLRGLGHKAVLEVVTSTAVALGHEHFGRPYVDLGVANEAVDRVERFIRDQGFGALVWAYLTVATLENYLALAHYGALREDEFVSGLHHRPWVQTPLDDELVLGVAWGSYRISVRDDRRWVELTPAGRELYASVRAMLEESGYLAERLRLIRLSEFNMIQDDTTRIAPEYNLQRTAFTAFAGLQPGMRVLELGCGTGMQTFDGGLLEAVGSAGSLVGLDPAVGMLRRAELRAAERGARNVEFVQGRGESLPFPDASFDAAVGFQFLEFTDAARTLAEMARVVRPGGVLAVGGACQPTLNAPWFRDWFLPIFDVASKHALEVRTPFYDPGRIPDLFPHDRCGRMQVIYRDSWGRLDDPDAAVQLLVHGASFFQEILEVLPWMARQELVEELKARGREVCARTSPEERTITLPVEFVRATA